MPKIHLTALDGLSRTMFISRGWDIIEHTDLDDETFVLFSGGEDVSPSLYGHKPHKTTYYNSHRDTIEASFFNKWIKNPKVGICRGGQFLNVMSGGTMYQDIDGHTKDHWLTDCDTSTRHLVTSTHHQMIRPSKEGRIIATAGESTYRETADHQYLEGSDYPMGSDIEVVFYPRSNSLCYQPHPEYGMKSCTDHFFEVIKRYYDLT